MSEILPATDKQVESYRKYAEDKKTIYPRASLEAKSILARLDDAEADNRDLVHMIKQVAGMINPTGTLADQIDRYLVKHGDTS